MHVHRMRDKARMFPDIGRPQEVTSACIWFCRYRSLHALAEFPHLRELKIGGFPDDSLEALGALHDLRYLCVVHLPGVRSLEPLRGLARLETLSLATLPDWEGRRRQVVSSLEPLVALPALTHLELLGVCPPDLSLAPLELCPNLVSARFTQYPPREVDRFELITQIPADFAPLPRFEERML
jgi:hypothetical protein